MQYKGMVNAFHSSKKGRTLVLQFSYIYMYIYHNQVPCIYSEENVLRSLLFSLNALNVHTLFETNFFGIILDCLGNLVTIIKHVFSPVVTIYGVRLS